MSDNTFAHSTTRGPLHPSGNRNRGDAGSNRHDRAWRRRRRGRSPATFRRRRPDPGHAGCGQRGEHRQLALRLAERADEQRHPGRRRPADACQRRARRRRGPSGRPARRARRAPGGLPGGLPGGARVGFPAESRVGLPGGMPAVARAAFPGRLAGADPGRVPRPDFRAAPGGLPGQNPGYPGGLPGQQLPGQTPGLGGCPGRSRFAGARTGPGALAR